MMMIIIFYLAVRLLSITNRMTKRMTIAARVRPTARPIVSASVDKHKKYFQ